MSYTDRSGDVIDQRYELCERLGAGATGAVYRATDAASGGQSVAVKILGRHFARDPEMRARFEREARALNGLSHPNLIRFSDFGLDAGCPYLVTELLVGADLRARLAAAPIAPTVALTLATGVLEGLAYAHANGVLHRDIKPSNVFVKEGAEGGLQPKLIDFGLARFFDRDRWGHQSTLTEDGTVLGTPTYMSPEQGFGSRVDARTDVYAAGTLLFELFAGRPPFVSKSSAMLIRAHALEEPPKLAEVRPGAVVDAALQSLLDRALAKRPEDRFDDGAALLRELHTVEPPGIRYA